MHSPTAQSPVDHSGHEDEEIVYTQSVKSAGSDGESSAHDNGEYEESDQDEGEESDQDHRGEAKEYREKQNYQNRGGQDYVEGGGEDDEDSEDQDGDGQNDNGQKDNGQDDDGQTDDGQDDDEHDEDSDKDQDLVGTSPVSEKDEDDQEQNRSGVDEDFEEQEKPAARSGVRKNRRPAALGRNKSAPDTDDEESSELSHGEDEPAAEAGYQERYDSNTEAEKEPKPRRATNVSKSRLAKNPKAKYGSVDRPSKKSQDRVRERSSHRPAKDSNSNGKVSRTSQLRKPTGDADPRGAKNSSNQKGREQRKRTQQPQRTVQQPQEEERKRQRKAQQSHERGQQRENNVQNSRETGRQPPKKERLPKHKEQSDEEDVQPRERRRQPQEKGTQPQEKIRQPNETTGKVSKIKTTPCQKEGSAELVEGRGETDSQGRLLHRSVPTDTDVPLTNTMVKLIAALTVSMKYTLCGVYKDTIDKDYKFIHSRNKNGAIASVTWEEFSTGRGIPHWVDSEVNDNLDEAYQDLRRKVNDHCVKKLAESVHRRRPFKDTVTDTYSTRHQYHGSPDQCPPRNADSPINTDRYKVDDSTSFNQPRYSVSAEYYPSRKTNASIPNSSNHYEEQDKIGSHQSTYSRSGEQCRSRNTELPNPGNNDKYSVHARASSRQVTDFTPSPPPTQYGSSKQYSTPQPYSPSAAQTPPPPYSALPPHASYKASQPAAQFPSPAPYTPPASPPPAAPFASPAPHGQHASAQPAAQFVSPALYTTPASPPPAAQSSSETPYGQYMTATPPSKSPLPTRDPSYGNSRPEAPYQRPASSQPLTQYQAQPSGYSSLLARSESPAIYPSPMTSASPAPYGQPLQKGTLPDRRGTPSERGIHRTAVRNAGHASSGIQSNEYGGAYPSSYSLKAVTPGEDSRAGAYVQNQAEIISQPPQKTGSRKAGTTSSSAKPKKGSGSSHGSTTSRGVVSVGLGIPGATGVELGTDSTGRKKIIGWQRKRPKV